MLGKWSKRSKFDREGSIFCLTPCTGKVLTIDEDEVQLNTKDDESSNANQKWVKSFKDAEGWFTLKNPNSKKVLTISAPENENSITIVEGKIL